MYRSNGRVAPQRDCSYLKASTWILFLSLAGVTHADAAAGYQIGAAANYSDNITRVPEDGVDEIVSNVNAAALWSNESPRLGIDAFAQLSYLSYADDTFDSELIPRGDVNLHWNVLPARMTWVLEDRYGQIASDPFAAFTPDNIENINVLRTGPDFEFGSSPSQLLTVSLRAEDQYYEVQPVDNQRLSAAARLQRRLSDTRSLALTVRGEEVEFDNPLVAVDYSIIESFVTFEQSLAEYSYAVDVGHTQLDVNSETVSGVLARLTGSRSIGANWFARASGEYSYTDSGNRFLIGRQQSSAGPGQSVDDDTLTAAGSPLRLKQFDVSLARQATRHSFDTVLYWEEEAYERAPLLDREQAGGTFSYQFSVNPLNTIVLASSYRRVRFETSDRDDENLEVELRYRRNLTSNLSIDFRAARLKRSSSDPTSVYEENVFGLSVTYASDLLDNLRRGTR